MSYCRFSSDDFQSDVYCYESESGFEIHVARRRREFSEPLPDQVDISDIDAWVNRQVEVHRIVSESSTLVPIGLPSDGSSCTVSTAIECLAELWRLREEGYHVPMHAIEALREETR